VDTVPVFARLFSQDYDTIGCVFQNLDEYHSAANVTARDVGMRSKTLIFHARSTLLKLRKETENKQHLIDNTIEQAKQSVAASLQKLFASESDMLMSANFMNDPEKLKDSLLQVYAQKNKYQQDIISLTNQKEIEKVSK
jgi:hypothetical protein